jgi:methyl-accepting chemotaxis protein
VTAVGTLQSAHRVVSTKAIPYMRGLSDVALAAKAAANDERGFLLTGNHALAREAVGRRDNERAGLALARASALNDAEVAAVDRVSVALAAFNTALDAEFASFAANPEGTVTFAIGTNRDLRKAYEARLATAINLADFEVAAATADNDRSASDSRVLLLAILALFMLFGGVATWAVARSVTQPLDETIAVLETAASGDLSCRADERGPVEFQRMAQATNQMLEATSAATRTIASSAAALMRTADDVTSASDRIAATAASTDGGTTHTISHAAAAIAGAIDGIAASSEQATLVAAEAVSSADTARGVVDQLHSTSQRIDSVVKLITSIAEQTNLLALNAAIEAAHAGEAGRGFAVVANEVKGLAAETAKATEDIATQVESIQTDTRRAVETIASIGDVITQVSEQQSVISDTVARQTNVTSEMNRSVEDILGNVARNREAVAALSATAADLLSVVDRFRH